MSTWQPVIIMAVSYSHDIATALLATCGISLWLLSKQFPADATPAAQHYFIRIYGGISRVAKDSLYWILLAGVPRIIFYREYEWTDLAGQSQIAAIGIKHTVIFTLVGAGIFFWLRLGRTVKALQAQRGNQE